MNSDTVLAKRELRQKLRAALEVIPAAGATAGSLLAQARLRQQSIWAGARSVLFYAPLPGEIDLFPMIDEALRDGKRIALPAYFKHLRAYAALEIRDARTDCAPGKFGILEPVVDHCKEFSLKQLDLVLIPGVGFDSAGLRLGRGQGFYDRLLAQVSGVKCGVAFDQQVVERIPEEQHDVRMNFILTPARWLEVSE